MLLDGYIRVSRVGGRGGERFISPSVQREQIEGWIHARRASVGEVFEELDESGARGNRPRLGEAIERVERGESAGLVVARLDRFGRSIADGLRAIQRIEQAGGTFASVQDGFDLGTSTGRLVLQVLFSIGEWELGRVRGNWEVARERAISRGVYIAIEPLGYRKAQDGRLLIDRREALLVREIFERRAQGEHLDQIAAHLNRRGERTKRGSLFRPSNLSRVIQNPAYRGEAHHGAYRNPDAHEPIVDRALWQLCQHTPNQGRGDDRSLLGGLLRCATCGRLMTTYSLSERGSPFHVYSCGAPQRICARRAYARGDQLDPLLEEFVFRRCGRRPGVERDELGEREAALRAAEKDLVAYRDDPSILATLGPTSFAEGLAKRQSRLEKGLVNLAKSKRAQTAPIELAALAEQWTELQCAERRAAIGKLIECVIVEPGRAPLIERARVFRSGSSPISRVHGRVLGAASSSMAAGERLRRHRCWSPTRLERELRGFLAGRSEWPSYQEFAEAGRARLFAQALGYGGPHYWGRRLGVRVPPFTVHWNREVVRAALSAFLKDRSTWPSPREFEEAGMLPVYHAAQRHEGVPYWAEQFGLSRRGGQRLRWPEERIAKELAKFTRGREDFPAKLEFDEAGLRPLYEVICRRGGIARWAERSGLAR
jgi:DNA invertase Pin-like site-specific DNA recombinase